MASGNPSPSNFPPSMGPGAQPMQSGESLAATARAIQEMRTHYQVRVEPTELKVSYMLNEQNRGFTIPFDAMPISGASKWLLYGGSGRAMVSGTFFLDMVRGTENMAGRHLTQREVESFALHTGKRMQYQLIGNLAAIGGGAGFAAWNYKTMRFPFRPVKPVEAYNVFPSERFAILRGQYARVTWQITRLNVYVALGMLFFNPFFRSMGESVMTVGLYRDERTKDIVKEVKGSFDRIRMNRNLPGQQNSASTPTSTSQSMEDSNAQEFYAKDSSSQSYYGKSTDYSSDNAFTDNTTDTGTLSDSAMRNRESQQSAPNSFGVDNYGQQPNTRQRSSNSDFFSDDASPTAGNDPDMGNSSRSQPGGSGSAWDRYRRGGSPSQSQTPSSSSQAQTTRPMQETSTWRSSRQQGQSQDFETKGDSFSFSDSDEQRALAKAQAQQEFDNMLDKERRESGSGEYEGSSHAAQTGQEDPGQSGGGESAWGRRRRN